MSNEQLATKRQKWAIYCATKIDNRDIVITKDQASDLISRSMSGEDITNDILALKNGESPKITKVSTKKSDKWQELYNLAHEAGVKAGDNHNPTPMVVSQHTNVLDDNSPVEKSWFVGGGVCGFAWVWFKGNTSWGKWAKKQGIARDSYPNGLQISCGLYNQSYERKMAYCSAFAEILRQHGINDAWANGRLD